MKLEFIESPRFNPHENLGVESVLLKTCPADTLRFYLWQNQHTVVIGKHQDAASEVFLDRLKEDHGTLARRSSGGGAVYHDLGNLNFSFIASTKHFDIQRQMNWIASALQALGYEAQVNGRNDIEVKGAKVSGNAFAHHHDFHLHHGTLLVNVDKAKLGCYLNVNPKKLQRKHVASVAARIMNLSEDHPLSIEVLKQHLYTSIQEATQTKATWLNFENFDAQDDVQFFKQDAWNFGTKMKGHQVFEECFDFGCFKWEITTEAGYISTSDLYSDSLDTLWVEELQKWIIGQPESLWIEHLKKYNNREEAWTQEIISALERR